MKKQTKSIMCEHANEVPAVCKCDKDCYCKDHTCKKTKKIKEIIKADKFRVKRLRAHFINYNSFSDKIHELYYSSFEIDCYL